MLTCSLALLIGYLFGVACGMGIYFCSFLKKDLIRIFIDTFLVLVMIACGLLLGFETKIVIWTSLINTILTVLVLAIIKMGSSRREDCYASGY